MSLIGLPNVGKSSLINSLKRSHVVNVGSTPGLTRSMQEVHLDKNVKLLDCPGVVMPKSQENDASVVLIIDLDMDLDFFLHIFRFGILDFNY